ncbi:MAG: ATP-binding cassette domain-containing protein [Chromatiales bacterium]|jgi:tungstate transport system ATP-binding protein
MPEAGTMTLDRALAPEQPSILPLQARGLVLELGGQRLIDGIDLDLRPDSRTVVMGPNGAGKSLLLRLLHGLIEPTAGAVRWSSDLGGRELRRRQAMVFQRSVLLRRSAAANVAYALAAHGVPRAERAERTRAALASARLDRLAARPARVLSGGEQQRLALARALSIGPEVLFLDEPTANLDPASTLAIEELIQAAHRAGTKIVFITHELAQARRLADDVVFMNAGRVCEHSPADRFFTAPRSEAAEAFQAGRLVF